MKAEYEELKKRIPSYYIIPPTSEEEERMMDEKKIIFAFVITDGEFKDSLIVIRELEIKPDEDIMKIHYNSFNKEDEAFESKELDKVVADIIQYITIQNLEEKENKKND